MWVRVVLPTIPKQPKLSREGDGFAVGQSGRTSKGEASEAGQCKRRSNPVFT